MVWASGEPLRVDKTQWSYTTPASGIELIETVDSGSVGLLSLSRQCIYRSLKFNINYTCHILIGKISNVQVDNIVTDFNKLKSNKISFNKILYWLYFLILQIVNGI